MLYSTNPNSSAFFKNIIIFLHNIFDYLDLFTINDTEEKSLVKDLNKDWDYNKTDIDYNSDEKNQPLENKDRKDSNTDIDKIYYNLDNKILLKIIYKEYSIENQKSDYSLEFDPKGVYLKKENEQFDKIKISDRTYQMGKVITIENEKGKNKVLAILIKNTDKESNIFLCCLDLVENTINYIIESEIPPIKDYSLHMVDENEKKQLILLLCCEFNLYLIQYEINLSNNKKYNLKSCDSIKTKYHFETFNPRSILPLRTFKKDNEIFEKYIEFSKYFLISSQTIIKLFKYNEKGDIIPICDVKFEDKEIQKLVEGNHINRIEQLDIGIISAYLDKKKLNCYLFLNEKMEKEKEEVN
jgi:hypothetical protein